MANAGRLTALPQGISRKVTVMNWSCRMGQLRALAAGVMLTTLLVALLPLSAQEQQPAQPAQEQQLLSDIQLQQLVAPIALYPDSLLAQVLTASTYPLEVAMAARWSEKNPKLTETVRRRAAANRLRAARAGNVSEDIVPLAPLDLERVVART
jgi:Protein of unknown function (DUF3300)